MLTPILIVAAVGLATVLASWFMWWATKRSGAWSMAAGIALAVIVIASALLIAWLLTRAVYGPQ